MNKTTAHRLGMAAFKRGARLEPYADSAMISGVKYSDDPQLFGELMAEWRRGWQEEGERDLKAIKLSDSSYCVDRTLSVIAHNNGFRNADALCGHIGICRKTLMTKMASKAARNGELKRLFESHGLRFTRGEIEYKKKEHSYVTGCNASMTLTDNR